MNCKHRDCRVCASCKRTERETRFTDSQKYLCSDCVKKREKISRERAKQREEFEKQTGAGIDAIIKVKKCKQCGLTENETAFYKSMTQVCKSCYTVRHCEEIDASEENRQAAEYNRLHPFRFEGVHKVNQQIITGR